MSTGRENKISRLGFILVSAGCAIGLGNVWRFPYVAGQNGGGAFVLIYLACLALIGLPVLLMEFATGRASKRSIATLHETLTPKKRGWRLAGMAGALGEVTLMLFYGAVTGWMMIYFVKTALGQFEGLSTEQIGGAFQAMLASPGEQAVAMVVVLLISAAVCALGVKRGVERVTKWMMALLLVLIVVLSIHSITLPGAKRGLEFFLMPDFARMRSVGVVKVVTEAMNQAFFTLSIGIGAMSIFGSYIGKERALLKEGVSVITLDTIVAICAGLVIIPACFAFGVDQTQGPGLVFVTLPNVFSHMTGGRVWGSMFFLFMSMAALTTAITVLECIVAIMEDWLGWSRRKNALVAGVALMVLSMPCIWGFNWWKDFHPLGPGSCVMDLEDFVVSNLLLPLGGITFAIYCSHKCGWGWQHFIDEVNAGEGPKFGGAFWRFHCRWILPAMVLAIFILGLLR